MTRMTLSERLRILGVRKDPRVASSHTEELRRRLEELEIRFGEYDHRVKNNTQMMLSILLSASRATSNLEVRSAFNAVSRKLQAIMQVQAILRHAGHARVLRCDALMRELAQAIQEASPHRFALILELEPNEMPSTAAVPISLIMNELLTNAVKHGISSDKGSVQVSLKSRGNLLELRVEDNGPGMDPSVLHHDSSGLTLVHHLAAQLHGRFDTRPGPGCECIVQFPKPNQNH